MAWRESLALEGDGSFRGIRFQVDRAESEAGRRTVLHEYPGRDIPHNEDQGRALRKYRLTCYVIGPDYDLQRDRLRVAFETAGPGELVHPFWGTFTASVTSPVRIQESANEGGIAQFTLELVSIGDEAITQIREDLEPLVQISVDNAFAAISAAFDSAMEVAGAVQAVRENAALTVQAAMDKAKAVRSAVNGALGIIDDVAGAIAAINNGISALVQNPLALAGDIIGVATSIFSAITTAGGSSVGVLAALLSVGREFGDVKSQNVLYAARELTAESEPDEVEPLGSQEKLAASNRAAIQLLTRRANAVAAVSAATRLEYESRDAALEARDTLSAICDELAIDAEYEVWTVLVSLRNIFVQRMNELAQVLPSMYEHTPREVLTALVIAYDLHGDAMRADELIARNGIEDPNFVPAEPLLVLNE